MTLCWSAGILRLQFFVQLKEAGDAPNPPKFLTLAMEARGEGGSGAEVEARQK